MSKERCETCKFSGFQKGLLGGKTYYCYRYPPHPVQEIGIDGKPKINGIKFISPEVHLNGWCGEFRGTNTQ